MSRTFQKLCSKVSEFLTKQHNLGAVKNIFDTVDVVVVADLQLLDRHRAIPLHHRHHHQQHGAVHAGGRPRRRVRQ